jgi:hypothetical protein
VNESAAKPDSANPGRNPVAFQPCSDFCANFRSLDPYRWPDFGRCLHPRSPLRGFPVRIGRDCREHQARLGRSL